jgi:hypothetical protein
LFSTAPGRIQEIRIILERGDATLDMLFPDQRKFWMYDNAKGGLSWSLGKNWNVAPSSGQASNNPFWTSDFPRKLRVDGLQYEPGILIKPLGTNMHNVDLRFMTAEFIFGTRDTEGALPVSDVKMALTEEPPYHLLPEEIREDVTARLKELESNGTRNVNSSKKTPNFKERKWFSFLKSGYPGFLPIDKTRRFEAPVDGEDGASKEEFTNSQNEKYYRWFKNGKEIVEVMPVEKMIENVSVPPGWYFLLTPTDELDFPMRDYSEVVTKLTSALKQLKSHREVIVNTEEYATIILAFLHQCDQNGELLFAHMFMEYDLVNRFNAGDRSRTTNAVETPWRQQSIVRSEAARYAKTTGIPEVHWTPFAHRRYWSLNDVPSPPTAAPQWLARVMTVESLLEKSKAPSFAKRKVVTILEAIDTFSGEREQTVRPVLHRLFSTCQLKGDDLRAALGAVQWANINGISVDDPLTPLAETNEDIRPDFFCQRYGLPKNVSAKIRFDNGSNALKCLDDYISSFEKLAEAFGTNGSMSKIISAMRGKRTAFTFKLRQTDKPPKRWRLDTSAWVEGAKLPSVSTFGGWNWNEASGGWEKTADGANRPTSYPRSEQQQFDFIRGRFEIICQIRMVMDQMNTIPPPRIVFLSRNVRSLLGLDSEFPGGVVSSSELERGRLDELSNKESEQIALPLAQLKHALKQRWVWEYFEEYGDRVFAKDGWNPEKTPEWALAEIDRQIRNRVNATDTYAEYGADVEAIKARIAVISDPSGEAYNNERVAHAKWEEEHRNNGLDMSDLEASERLHRGFATSDALRMFREEIERLRPLLQEAKENFSKSRSDFNSKPRPVDTRLNSSTSGRSSRPKSTTTQKTSRSIEQSSRTKRWADLSGSDQTARQNTLYEKLAASNKGGSSSAPIDDSIAAISDAQRSDRRRLFIKSGSTNMLSVQAHALISDLTIRLSQLLAGVFFGGDLGSTDREMKEEFVYKSKMWFGEKDAELNSDGKYSKNPREAANRPLIGSMQVLINNVLYILDTFVPVAIHDVGKDKGFNEVMGSEYSEPWSAEKMTAILDSTLRGSAYTRGKDGTLKKISLSNVYKQPDGGKILRMLQVLLKDGAALMAADREMADLTSDELIQEDKEARARANLPESELIFVKKRAERLVSARYDLVDEMWARSVPFGERAHLFVSTVKERFLMKAISAKDAAALIRAFLKRSCGRIPEQDADSNLTGGLTNVSYDDVQTAQENQAYSVLTEGQHDYLLQLLDDLDQYAESGASVKAFGDPSYPNYYKLEERVFGNLPSKSQMDPPLQLNEDEIVKQMIENTDQDDLELRMMLVNVIARGDIPKTLPGLNPQGLVNGVVAFPSVLDGDYPTYVQEQQLYELTRRTRDSPTSYGRLFTVEGIRDHFLKSLVVVIDDDWVASDLIESFYIRHMISQWSETLRDLGARILTSPVAHTLDDEVFSDASGVSDDEPMSEEADISEEERDRFDSALYKVAATCNFWTTTAARKVELLQMRHKEEDDARQKQEDRIRIIESDDNPFDAELTWMEDQKRLHVFQDEVREKELEWINAVNERIDILNDIDGAVEGGDDLGWRVNETMDTIVGRPSLRDRRVDYYAWNVVDDILFDYAKFLRETQDKIVRTYRSRFPVNQPREETRDAPQPDPDDARYFLPVLSPLDLSDEQKLQLKSRGIDTTLRGPRDLWLMYDQLPGENAVEFTTVDVMNVVNLPTVPSVEATRSSLSQRNVVAPAVKKSLLLPTLPPKIKDLQWVPTDASVETTAESSGEWIGLRHAQGVKSDDIILQTDPKGTVKTLGAIKEELKAFPAALGGTITSTEKSRHYLEFALPPELRAVYKNGSVYYDFEKNKYTSFDEKTTGMAAFKKATEAPRKLSFQLVTGTPIVANKSTATPRVSDADPSSYMPATVSPEESRGAQVAGASTHDADGGEDDSDWDLTSHPDSSQLNSDAANSDDLC